MSVTAVGVRPQVGSPDTILKKSLVLESDTAKKIHTLVVIGNILITTGVVISLASIALAIVINPLCLLGLIAAVALCIIGSQLIDNDNSSVKVQPFLHEPLKPLSQARPRGLRTPAIYHEAPRAPFIPGQPVGLANACCNCWANSMLQFLMNISNYADRIVDQADENNSLAINMRRYRASQASCEFRSSEVDTQQIRLYLNETMDQTLEETRISRYSYTQEDPSASLAFILGTFNLIHSITPGTPGAEAFIDLLFPDQGEKIDFIGQINQFFTLPEDARGNQFRRFSDGAPDDFIVKQKRYFDYFDPISHARLHQGKHSQAVEIPKIFNLSSVFVAGATEETRYEPYSFISHIGDSLRSGHYIAYCKKVDPQTKAVTYWECNDSRISQISEIDFFREIQTSYFIHFKKIE